ncbi:MAG TPA: cysteine desulfurase family protein [Nakamurella sp.]|jgi:cysteine desulfurase|nr:cysteine desulfurase family protein [Nakamurella sp.]
MTYLDHAATTPVLPAVVDAVADAMRQVGNASSLHAAGRAARRRVEESRESVAAALGARPSEVVVTSGGTEADNMAVTGILRARRAADPRRRRLLIPATEHHAVLDCAEALQAAGEAEIGWLEVDDFGRVHADTLAAAIATDPDSVALVSVMWANNEVGTVNPIRELAEVAHRSGVPLHTDAVQAFGALPLDFAASGADALSVTAHKIGGPLGVGALVLRRDVPLTPIGHGGGQERGIRSGTLDMPALVGFAVAAADAAEHRAERAARLAALRDDLIAAVLAVVPDAVLSGDPGRSLVDGGPSRLPGNAHLRFPGCQGDALLMLLDAAGIACSTGSACTAGVARPSHVLLAMGVSERDAAGALRFSLGHTSTEADVRALAEVIGPVVRRARAAALAGARR